MEGEEDCSRPIRPGTTMIFRFHEGFLVGRVTTLGRVTSW